VRVNSNPTRLVPLARHCRITGASIGALDRAEHQMPGAAAIFALIQRTETVGCRLTY
jgi:hypothetical protein